MCSNKGYEGKCLFLTLPHYSANLGWIHYQLEQKKVTGFSFGFGRDGRFSLIKIVCVCCWKFKYKSKKNNL